MSSKHANEPGNRHMLAEENKTIVRHYLEETWNQRNLAVIDELVAPD